MGQIGREGMTGLAYGGGKPPEDEAAAAAGWAELDEEAGLEGGDLEQALEGRRIISWARLEDAQRAAARPIGPVKEAEGRGRELHASEIHDVPGDVPGEAVRSRPRAEEP